MQDEDRLVAMYFSCGLRPGVCSRGQVYLDAFLHIRGVRRRSEDQAQDDRSLIGIPTG